MAHTSSFIPIFLFLRRGGADGGDRGPDTLQWPHPRQGYEGQGHTRELLLQPHRTASREKTEVRDPINACV